MTTTKASIRVPTFEMMVSLAHQLRWVPGEAGTRIDYPDFFQVHFAEFPQTDKERDELLASVQEWLDENSFESLTVEVRDRTYTLRPAEK